MAASDRVVRRLAALLSADVVGYSRLMAQDEVATLKTLGAHRDAMGGLIRQHGGRVVDAVGDNLLAEFRSVVDATACAVAIQQELGERNAELSSGRKMQLRIGIHLGDVVVKDDRLYGDGVNIAARLEALADPGGICISADVYRQVRHKVPLHYEDLGDQTLKNIPDPVGAYRARPGTAEELEEDVALTVPGFAGRPAIAVLPFDNLSGDDEQEYFSEGIVEDLTTRLSMLRLFPVIARSSSSNHEGKPLNVKRLGRDLGARFLIEGSVRKAGARVRIAVRLIEAISNHHIWAKQYDRQVEDILTAQDEIVEAIVTAIEPTLETFERQRALRLAPEALGAWDCVRRGMWHVDRYTKADLAEAQALFRKAAELDPMCSSAFSSLALSHFEALSYQWSDSRARSLAQAKEAALKSVELDADDPVAHYTLGMIFLSEGKVEQAIAEHERAAELNPSSALAYSGLGYALAMSGRVLEGIRVVEKALRLAPRGSTMRYILLLLGFCQFAAERYEDAVESVKRSVASRYEQPQCHGLLAASYGHLDRIEDARRELAELFRLLPDFAVRSVRLYLWPAVFERYVEGWRKAGGKVGTA